MDAIVTSNRLPLRKMATARWSDFGWILRIPLIAVGCAGCAAGRTLLASPSAPHVLRTRDWRRTPGTTSPSVFRTLGCTASPRQATRPSGSQAAQCTSRPIQACSTREWSARSERHRLLESASVDFRRLRLRMSAWIARALNCGPPCRDSAFTHGSRRIVADDPQVVSAADLLARAGRAGVIAERRRNARDLGAGRQPARSGARRHRYGIADPDPVRSAAG